MPTEGRTNDGQNRLHALPVEALENMLQDAVLSGDGSDKSLELIDSIIAELDSRKADEPPMSADESYEEFLADYANKDSLYLDCAAHSPIARERTVTRRRHRLSTVARVGLISAALVAVLLATMIAAQAAGIDVFRTIARWTADVFGFGYSATDERGSSDDGVGDAILPQFVELRNALEENGLPTEYIPTYWPEGYGEPVVNVDVNHLMTIITCCFTKSTSEAVISFSTPNPDSGDSIMQYNKDDINPIVFGKSGLTFYMMENIDNILAVGTDGTIEISIFGIAEKDDLIQIIKSIGVQS